MDLWTQLFIAFLVYVPVAAASHLMGTLINHVEGGRIFDLSLKRDRVVLILISVLWPVSIIFVICSFWVFLLTEIFSKIGKGLRREP